MEIKHISSSSEFEERIGYSRAVIAGQWIFVSGTTGYNYETMSISEDLIEQAEQCFKNLTEALEKAGASLENTVRVLYIFPDASSFEKCTPVLRKYFGNIKPAATMISAGLADPKMKLEIQVTAYKNAGP